MDNHTTEHPTALVVVSRRDTRPTQIPLPSDLPADGRLVVIRPESAGVKTKAATERVYEGRLSITNHRDLWWPLRSHGVERVHVVSEGDLESAADALAIAAHVGPARVTFSTIGDKSVRDVTDLVGRMVVDFDQPTARFDSLSADGEASLRREMHRFYVDEVVSNSYEIPHGVNPQQEALQHFSDHVGLAQDLMMRVPEICKNPWWSTAVTIDGRFGHSVDHRLAYAELLERLPETKSFLEVGCGSGFLPAFLARRGRFSKVAAVDAVENRVRGARMLAEIAEADVSFGTASAADLPFGDDEFDVVATCFTLEQCEEIIDGALDELSRVAGRYLVMFEPSVELFPTVPGLVHVARHGYPTTFLDRLQRRGLPYTVVKPRLRHYYNPGVVLVVSTNDSEPLHVKSPGIHESLVAA